MNVSFPKMLAEGGRTNSLGRVNEVIDIVLNDRSKIDELYECLFDDDAWIRMRAADALEKVCRQHPDWLLPFVDRFADELSSSKQPSIQWHLAQIYSQVQLTARQKTFVMNWLKSLLANTDIDWIVSANAMDTLAQFAREGSFASSELIKLAEIQMKHRSTAIQKRANKLLLELSEK